MTTENNAPEKLSDADLDKALNGDEQVINDEGEVESGIETSDETVPLDEATEETSGQATPQAKPPVESLEERLAKMEKRIADKDRYIEERNAEIGKLRKLAAEPKKLHEVNADNFFEDPIANVEKITENQRIKLEQEQERRMELARDEFEKRRTITKQIAPDYEQNVDLVADVLKQDGFDDEGLKAFKSNPFAWDAPLLHNLNARAKLAKENADLKAEIAKLRGNPKKILDRVDAISRQKPRVTGSSQASTSEGTDVDTLDEKSISKLSNKQLEELLKKARKR